MTLVDSLCLIVIIPTDDSLCPNAIIHIIGSLLDIVIIIMSDSLHLLAIMQTCGSLGMIDCC